jgi:hypothetical protein
MSGERILNPTPNLPICCQISFKAASGTSKLGDSPSRPPSLSLSPISCLHVYPHIYIYIHVCQMFLSVYMCVFLYIYLSLAFYLTFSLCFSLSFFSILLHILHIKRVQSICVKFFWDSQNEKTFCVSTRS